MRARPIALALVLGALACGCGATTGSVRSETELTPLPNGEHCFEGSWEEREGDQLQRFAFRLTLTVDDRRAGGFFDWRALELSAAPRLVGREAREELIGEHDAGALELRGLSIDDPLSDDGCVQSPRGKEVAFSCGEPHPPFMAPDRYRISVVGGDIHGSSRTHEGDWSGELRGTTVPCGARVRATGDASSGGTSDPAEDDVEVVPRAD